MHDVPDLALQLLTALGPSGANTFQTTVGDRENRSVGSASMSSAVHRVISRFRAFRTFFMEARRGSLICFTVTTAGIRHSTTSKLSSSMRWQIFLPL